MQRRVHFRWTRAGKSRASSAEQLAFDVDYPPSSCSCYPIALPLLSSISKNPTGTFWNGYQCVGMVRLAPRNHFEFFREGKRKEKDKKKEKKKIHFFSLFFSRKQSQYPGWDGSQCVDVSCSACMYYDPSYGEFGLVLFSFLRGRGS